MIRVTATMLEAFRRYNTNEFMSFDDLLATLRGKVEPNAAMEFGTAVHALLEFRPKWEGAMFMAGHEFDTDSIIRAHTWTDQDYLTEVTGHKVYEIDGDIVYLRCMADAVFGRKVVDYKITQSSISDTKLQGYQDSMQWKAYLEVFDADEFGYSVQQWKQRDSIWYLEDVQWVTCTRYEGLQYDVANAVKELYHFCKRLGIMDALYKENHDYVQRNS